MILHVNGKEYIVHFQHHTKLEEKFTFCVMHEGRCAQPKECEEQVRLLSRNIQDALARRAVDAADAFLTLLSNKGAARCSPADQFEKWTGRKVAFRRALNSIPRGERKAFWDAYFKVSPIR